MDTKLKNNKKSLNWMIYLIAISILITMISARILDRSESYDNFSYRYNVFLESQMEQVCDVVPNLALYAEDTFGNLKEDSIESAVNYKKSQIELYKSGNKEADYYEQDLNKSDEEIRESVINNTKQQVNSYMRTLKDDYKNVEYYYEAKIDGKVYTNTNATSKEEFEKEALKNNKENLYIKNGVYARISEEINPDDSIFLANKEYKKKIATRYICIGLLVISFVNVLFVIIRLLINKKNQTLEIKETYFSKIYYRLFVEVKFIIAFIMINVVELIWNTLYGFQVKLMYISLVAFVIYLILLDLIRISKSKEIGNLIKSKSLILKIVCYFKTNYMGYLKESKFVKSIFSRVVAMMCLFTVIMIIMWIGLVEDIVTQHTPSILVGIAVIVAIILGNIYILIIGSSINKIIVGSRNISKGMYEEKIDVKGSRSLKEIANNIENIQLGLKDAVDKAVKSEKMKGELITNVSHDLKTPLTSIINYVDLLEQKNISEKDKEKYINVLKEKSNRLKVLIEDLFEVSKASSGSMELNMDNIDVVYLITQTLVELEDKIETSGLSFIRDFPKEKVIVYADGRKLFRVFQNLLSNIFKYSMKNSRVYIEVKDNIDYVEIIFKNISEHKINFTEEEIFQRFKRGDESRTTEGSGLGLSIVKSLVELQRGKVNIQIDGDLFKVIIKLVKD